MKHPVYWFLISSGLIASTSLSFAQGESQTLTPADSYNGNGTFTPKTSSNSTSTTYTCEGNVCIANAGNSSALTSSCFTQSAGDLLFIGNGYSLCFEGINTTSKPAAIDASASNKKLSVNNFSLFSCSFCPPGSNGKGAIKIVGNSTFSSNSDILFNRNCSTDSGGAINCGEELIFEGNRKLIFSENSSSTSGGAIYTKKLTLTAEGLTLFSNNSVSKDSDPKGGAICLNDSSSECSLNAALGDIIFDGNKIITTGNSAKTVRNSIDLGTGGKFMKLNAKEGFGIFFYDPISNGDANSEIEINKTENSINYTGQIVFSGERLTKEERQVADNLKSTFKQKVKIGSGSLVLKDGVTLEAKSFTQTGGTVVMDLGTNLQATSTSGEDITLTDLVINTASLGGGGVSLHQHKFQPVQPTKMLQSNLLI
ncbi:polymorphic outer membrane protein middle domain-containing protein [Chlamydia crocodili]|uniref:polymorphic outer membrane protein middle domain-containing protein n=1 Tax=Chlamydia crocodili TaxID=2766982 RepID=UPI0038996A20